MQQTIQTIRRDLNGLYTSSEISVLTRLILEEVCSTSFAGIATDKINHLSGFQTRKMEDILSRLKRGEPHQYVMGKTSFYGMAFRVTSDVLIPRPETEELVEWILTENRSENPTVLDIGTGSGCIAVALAKKIPAAEVWAWDISDNALKIAAGNAEINHVTVHFSRQDILQSITAGMTYDIVVSNPPYVMESEAADMERTVLDFEPHEALFVPDFNPLLFYERIADAAFAMLNDGGRLYFEINRSKGPEIVEMLEGRGFVEIELRKDISGNDRMIRADKPRVHGEDQ